LLVLLVLVDNEPVSFSAVRAHVLPGLVKSILEHVNCRSINNMLRHTVPDVDHSVGEERPSYCGPASRLEQLPSVAT